MADRSGGSHAAGASRPTLIVVRKHKKHHTPHHGGAWKVAYADFVTAMMAFFLVMWLVNQNKDVKTAVGGYFRDPLGTEQLAGSKSSQGADGILSAGTGATEGQSGILDLPASRAMQQAAHEREEEQLERLAERVREVLADLPGFSEISHLVQVELTEEGLRIELMESEKGTFFERGSRQIDGSRERCRPGAGADDRGESARRRDRRPHGQSRLCERVLFELGSIDGPRQRRPEVARGERARPLADQRDPRIRSGTSALHRAARGSSKSTDLDPDATTGVSFLVASSVRAGSSKGVAEDREPIGTAPVMTTRAKSRGAHRTKCGRRKMTTRRHECGVLPACHRPRDRVIQKIVPIGPRPLYAGDPFQCLEPCERLHVDVVKTDECFTCGSLEDPHDRRWTRHRNDDRVGG